MARTPSGCENFSAASLCYGGPDISDFTYDVFFFRVPLNPTDLSGERFTQAQRNYIKWFRLASIINYHGAPQKDERESTSVADHELQKSPAQETGAVGKEIPIGEARKSTGRHEGGSVHQEHAAEERATDQEPRESPAQENAAAEKESSTGESVQENTAEERETDRRVAAKEERESAPVADQEPQKSSTPGIEAVEKESSAGESVQENTAEDRETDQRVAAKEERESAPVADREPQKSSTPEIEAVEKETLAGEDQKSTGAVGETTVQEERETDQKVTANEERENPKIPALDLEDPAEFPSLRKYERITKKEKRGEFQRLRGQSKP